MDFLVAALLCSVFVQTRIVNFKHAILCAAAQSALLGAACVLAVPEEGRSSFVLLLVTAEFFLKVFCLPCLLMRIARGLEATLLLSGTHVHLTTAGTACSLALSYMFLDAMLPLDGSERDILAVAFCMIAAGLILIVLRRQALMQMLGLLLLENGVLFLAIPTAATIPSIMLLSVFLDIFYVAISICFLAAHLLPPGTLGARGLLQRLVN